VAWYLKSKDEGLDSRTTTCDLKLFAMLEVAADQHELIPLPSSSRSNDLTITEQTKWFALPHMEMMTKMILCIICHMPHVSPSADVSG